MGNRRLAREMGLKILYESELQKVEESNIINRIFETESLSSEVKSFLTTLVECYQKHSKDVDAKIESCSENWKLHRMSVVDRSLLRLGVTEILFFDDIPKSVSINEYLELAKKFGTQDSKNFINGILDKMKS